MKRNEATPSERSDRRQWLIGGLRYGLLGALTVLSGHLVARSQSAECRQPVACQKCGAWDSCRMPLAIETRRKTQG
jgi:hypothetical protein